MAGKTIRATSKIMHDTFSARFDSGHVAFMGGDAPFPTELVVAGLAGCSGLTLESMLQKMGIAHNGIEVEVTAVRQAEAPTVFTSFKIVYRVRAEASDGDKIHKAVALADKYCPVYQTLIKAAPIESSVIVEQ